MPAGSNKPVDGDKQNGQKTGPRSRARAQETASAQESTHEVGAAVQEALSASLEPVVSEYVERSVQAIRPSLEEFEQAMAQVVREGMSRELHPGEIAPGSTTTQQNAESPAASPDTDRITRSSERSPGNTQGGAQMATETGEKQQTKSRRGEANKSDDSGENQQEEQDQNQTQSKAKNQSSGDSGRREQAAARRESSAQEASQGSGRPRYVYNPSGAVQAALLRLATNWRATGSVHQAMAAYTEILVRYPGTGAAQAAAEDLVSLADALEKEGMFYSALAVLRKVEAYG